MSDDDLTHIGTRIKSGFEAAAFGIRRVDRRQHLVALGKTGTGKSTLLEHLILQDIAAGEGVALLDPHGATAERLLDCIPPWRTDDLCYFDPADRARPIGFNPLACVSAERRHLNKVGQFLLSPAMRHVFGQRGLPTQGRGAPLLSPGFTHEQPKAEGDGRFHNRTSSPALRGAAVSKPECVFPKLAQLPKRSHALALAVPRALFAAILKRIERLRGPPVSAT